MANEWLRYANQGATRNLPLDPRLVEALGFLPEMGLSMEVFSGGQPSSGPRRTGSHRHDHGHAADAFFYKDGRRLDWANKADVPIFQQLVQQAKARGVAGIGAGEGYMRPGSMHIGFGSPSVWGAGGKGANAPSWLRQAYGGAPVGAAPAATATAPTGAPTSALAGMMASGPTAAPQMFGDLIGQNQVATTAVGPMDFGSVAANLLKSSQERDARQAEIDAAETARKVALFGGADGSGLWGLYA